MVGAKFLFVKVISEKVSRSKLEAAVQELSPETVAMKACASAHHWGRRFEALRHSVRLIHLRFVKGCKNDAVAAEAIHEAGPLRIRWKKGMRAVGDDFPLYPSVEERVRAKAVAQYGEVKPYRPAQLKERRDLKCYYDE